MTTTSTHASPSVSGEQPLRALRGSSVYGKGSKTELSRSQVYSMIKEGTFPPGFMLARNVRAWLEHDIDSWLRERALNHPADKMPTQLAKGRAAKAAKNTGGEA